MQKRCLNQILLFDYHHQTIGNHFLQFSVHFILSKSEPIQTIKLNGDDLCKKDFARESDPIQSSNNIADWELSLLNNLCPIDGWCFS